MISFIRVEQKAMPVVPWYEFLLALRHGARELDPRSINIVCFLFEIAHKALLILAEMLSRSLVEKIAIDRARGER